MDSVEPARVAASSRGTRCFNVGPNGWNFARASSAIGLSGGAGSKVNELSSAPRKLPTVCKQQQQEQVQQQVPYRTTPPR